MFIYIILIFLVSLPILSYLGNLYERRLKSDWKNICVLVLGDIGRSPRMQYHAISFAKEGFIVDVVGYPGSPPMREIRENTRIRIHYLRPPPEMQNGILLAHLFIKFCFSYSLFIQRQYIKTIYFLFFFFFSIATSFVLHSKSGMADH